MADIGLENYKTQESEVWATQKYLSFLIFMPNAEAVRDEALEGFWFKQSWLILQAKNWSCCLDNAE